MKLKNALLEIKNNYGISVFEDKNKIITLLNLMPLDHEEIIFKDLLTYSYSLMPCISSSVCIIDWQKSLIENLGVDKYVSIEFLEIMIQIFEIEIKRLEIFFKRNRKDKKSFPFGNIVTLDNDFIYYANYRPVDKTEQKGIYRLKKNGTEKFLLYEAETYCINYHNGFIYYLNSKRNNCLFVIGVDGNDYGEKQLTSKNAIYFI